MTPSTRWTGLALVVVGALLIAGCGGDDDTGTDTGAGSEGDDSAEPVTDDADDLGEAVAEQADAEPVELIITEVEVPANAPAGVDACGDPISYEGDLLADGITDTAWRIEGDATGRRITFTLDEPRVVNEVGMVPGYAKVDPCDGADRFVQNRRVTHATWTFDDGTTVDQVLEDRPEMQTIAVDPTSTSTVVLVIESVTAPSERDFTAVSEVSIRGT